MSLDSHFKKHLFSDYSENPARWLERAQALKWAADQVCWLDLTGEPIRQLPDAVNLAHTVGIYRMLIGMAFETLIKGMAIANGTCVVKGGKLNGQLATHNLRKLYRLAGTTATKLSDDEIRILEELQAYVEWQGRYPIPREAEMFALESHGTGDHRTEQTLFRRLAKYLAENACLHPVSNDRNVDGNVHR